MVVIYSAMGDYLCTPFKAMKFAQIYRIFPVNFNENKQDVIVSARNTLKDHSKFQPTHSEAELTYIDDLYIYTGYLRHH